MTPSAYRKLVRVATRCKDERDPGTFLVVVRAVNVDEAPTVVHRQTSYRGLRHLCLSIPVVFEEAEGVEKALLFGMPSV